jgi:hypothetical protein
MVQISQGWVDKHVQQIDGTCRGGRVREGKRGKGGYGWVTSSTGEEVQPGGEEE